MNKLISTVLILILSMMVVTRVLAAGGLNNPINGSGSFESTVSAIISVVLSFVGVIALVAFIYGGVLWMTSAGNEPQVAKAKQVMIWAVFGAVAIFISYALVTLIFTGLGIGGGESGNKDSEENLIEMPSV